MIALPFLTWIDQDRLVIHLHAKSMKIGPFSNNILDDTPMGSTIQEIKRHQLTLYQSPSHLALYDEYRWYKESIKALLKKYKEKRRGETVPRSRNGFPDSWVVLSYHEKGEKRIKILFYKGLPGSGKTTLALEYLAAHPEAIRVNKDTIRERLFAGQEWTREQEIQVILERDATIGAALACGHDAVVDDTNLYPGHLARIEEIASLHRVEVEIIDLTDVPPEVCIARDEGRAHPVGREVIMQMYERYLKKDNPIG